MEFEFVGLKRRLNELSERLARLWPLKGRKRAEMDYRDRSPILIAIGILGEYVGRLYEEAKKRPLYIIDTKLGIGDQNTEADRHADTDN